MHLTEHNLGCSLPDVASEQPEAAGAPELRSIAEEIKSFNDVGLKAFKANQNTLSFKGLSLLEDYLKCRLWIVLEYRPTARCKFDKFAGGGFFAIVNANRESYKSDVSSTWGFNSDAFANAHFLRHGDQDAMLVCDIKHVESVQTKLPVFVGLYLVDDYVNNRVRRRESGLFVSIDQVFKFFPFLTEGEVRPIGDLVTVGFHHDTVSVIEGGPEVMDGIAEHGWSVLGEGGEIGAFRAFQPATIFLGPKSLHVARDVSAEYDFELADVMFGPFYL
jgi:hypothetical protein